MGFDLIFAKMNYKPKKPFNKKNINHNDYSKEYDELCYSNLSMKQFQRKLAFDAKRFKFDKNEKEYMYHSYMQDKYIKDMSHGKYKDMCEYAKLSVLKQYHQEMKDFTSFPSNKFKVDSETREALFECKKGISFGIDFQKNLKYFLSDYSFNLKEHPSFFGEKKKRK